MLGALSSPTLAHGILRLQELHRQANGMDPAPWTRVPLCRPELWVVTLMCRRPVSPRVLPVLPVPANPPLAVLELGPVVFLRVVRALAVGARAMMCGVQLRPPLLWMVP